MNIPSYDQWLEVANVADFPSNISETADMIRKMALHIRSKFGYSDEVREVGKMLEEAAFKLHQIPDTAEDRFSSAYHTQ